MKLQARRGGDRLGDLDDRLGRRHAAAAGAAVDLDEALERGAVLLRRRREVGDVRHVVDADDDAAAVLRQPGEPVDLRRVADLVRDQDVLDAAAGEDLGLDTFWQQTPTAPPSSICSFGTSTDLCILPCARWRMSWAWA